MKYKEFVNWCNERACDGCWGITEAIICIYIYNHMKSIHFWNRKKEWSKIEPELVRDIINPINKKIKEIYGEMRTK